MNSFVFVTTVNDELMNLQKVKTFVLIHVQHHLD